MSNPRRASPRGELNQRWPAIVALVLAALLVALLPTPARAAFPVSPSPQHKCEKGARDAELKGDCFKLSFIRGFQESFIEAIQKADIAAVAAERRAARTGLNQEWRKAVRQRAAARTVATQTLGGIDGVIAFARGAEWRNPAQKALGIRLLSATRALVVQHRRRMIARLVADLQRVKDPRPLPSFGVQTRRVKAADRRRRRADAAVKRVTGTLPSTVAAGGDLGGMWDEYSRRMTPITQLITRISGPLGQRMSKRERAGRLALLAELVTIYRNEGRQFENRVKAASGDCRARILDHMDNQLQRAIEAERYLRAFQDGDARFVVAARNQYRKRGVRGRAIAGGVRRCLRGQTPPPSPPPGAGRATRASCLGPIQINTGTDTDNVNDYAVVAVEERTNSILCTYVRTNAPELGGPTLTIWWTPGDAGRCDLPAGEPVRDSTGTRHSTRREISAILVWSGTWGFVSFPDGKRVDLNVGWAENVIRAAEAEGAGKACA